MTPESILFALLRAAVCGEQVTEKVKAACTPEALEQVYILAAKHDLAHLPGHVLGNLGMPDCLPMRAMKQAAFGAVQRYLRLEYELGQICNAFEQAQIPYIPLKGAVIRSLYPEPWMRTSCDIDVLIHEEDLERAAEVLINNLVYRRGECTPHDISLYASNGTHLELHHTTMEEGEIDSAHPILFCIWEDACAVESSQSRNEISDELFYFYHIAHMAKHVRGGGCGMRPFLDLWVLNHRANCNREKREALLKQGGLLQFATAVEKLSEIWFSAAPMDADSEKFEQFLLRAGVYGSMENRVMVGSSHKGGKLQYALSRIFLSYDTLKLYYPVIKRYRALTPVFQFVRWFRILLTGRTQYAANELRTNVAGSSRQIMLVKELFEYLRLDYS